MTIFKKDKMEKLKLQKINKLDWLKIRVQKETFICPFLELIMKFHSKTQWVALQKYLMMFLQKKNLKFVRNIF